MRWPLFVNAIGAAATGSVLWRTEGQLHLTVIVKATFAFCHETWMRQIEPRPLVIQERHREDDPAQSLQAATDVVPYRPRTDVWVTAHACGPMGQPVPFVVARLALFRGAQAVLDKSVHVCGDRAGPGAAPAPFTRMPILYERAYGGIGFEDNPAGVGAEDASLLPNVFDPDDPERVVGLGPVSRFWAHRRRFVTARVRRALEQRVAEVPRELDWSYFQSAPADQQVDHLHGDEWVVLDGMHASLLRLQTRLPRMRAVARVRPRGDDRNAQPVQLVLDTLGIDADEQVADLVWRGHIPIESEGVLEHLEAAAGLEAGDEALDWAFGWKGQPPGPRRGVRFGASGFALDDDAADEEAEDPLDRTSIDAPAARRSRTPARREGDDGPRQGVVEPPASPGMGEDLDEMVADAHVDATFPMESPVGSAPGAHPARSASRVRWPGADEDAPARPRSSPKDARRRAKQRHKEETRLGIGIVELGLSPPASAAKPDTATPGWDEQHGERATLVRRGAGPHPGLGPTQQPSPAPGGELHENTALIDLGELGVSRAGKSVLPWEGGNAPVTPWRPAPPVTSANRSDDVSASERTGLVDLGELVSGAKLPWEPSQGPIPLSQLEETMTPASQGKPTRATVAAAPSPSPAPHGEAYAGGVPRPPPTPLSQLEETMSPASQRATDPFKPAAAPGLPASPGVPLGQLGQTVPIHDERAAGPHGGLLGLESTLVPSRRSPPVDEQDDDDEPLGGTGAIDLRMMRALGGGALPWERRGESAQPASPPGAPPPGAPTAWAPEPQPPEPQPPEPRPPEALPSAPRPGGESTMLVSVDEIRRGSTPFSRAAAAPVALETPGLAPPGPPLAGLPPGLGAQTLPPRRSDAVPCYATAPVAVATRSWRVGTQQPSLVVVAKATCELRAGQAAALLDVPDPLSGDRAHGGAVASADRSLAYASDFAVLKPRADVTLVGHAIARGEATPAVRVRFRFGDMGSAGTPRTPGAGFDRSIVVFGDRTWRKALLSSGPSDPEPFERMPLTYERAFGGPDRHDNPVGVGARGPKDPPGEVRLPNLEDPRALLQGPGDSPAAACFAPVHPGWAIRGALARGFDARWRAEGWPALPKAFDAGYFQSAPAPQQLPYLRGDEPFLLEGVHAERHRLEGSLPGLRLRCFVHRSGIDPVERFDEVALHLDTAAFDTDAMRLQLVWRGITEVGDRAGRDVEALFLLAEPVGAPLCAAADAQRQYQALRQGLAFLEEVPAGVVERTTVEHGELQAGLRARPAPGSASTASGDAAVDVRARVLAALDDDGRLDGLDLGGADLSGLDFAGASLVGVQLRGAVLTDCRFTEADLSRAILVGADLGRAILDGARLTSADLTGANLEAASLVAVELSEADLSRARGSGAIFESATGAGARFTDGDWTGARFGACSLSDANFSGATLDRAVLDGAELPGLRLYDARGSGASFDRARVPRVRANGARLDDCLFADVEADESVWEGACLAGSSFTHAELRGATFAGADCGGAVFGRATLVEARFDGARLVDAIFTHANLMRASFEGADLTSADLRSANLYAAETFEAILTDARLEKAIVAGTKLDDQHA